MDKAHRFGLVIFVWIELYLIYGVGHGFTVIDAIITMIALLIAPIFGMLWYEKYNTVS